MTYISVQEEFTQAQAARNSLARSGGLSTDPACLVSVAPICSLTILLKVLAKSFYVSQSVFS